MIALEVLCTPLLGTGGQLGDVLPLARVEVIDRDVDTLAQENEVLPLGIVDWEVGPTAALTDANSH